MPPAVPSIEVPNNGDNTSIGRPDSKLHAPRTLQNMQMRPEFFIFFVVVAFPHQMQIEIRKHRRKAIRVDEFECSIVVIEDSQVVVERKRLAFERNRKESFG